MSWKPPPKPPLPGSFRPHCFECGATDTPKWRFGQTLCNACGLKRKTQQARGWALPLPAAITGGAPKPSPKRGRPLKASLDHQVVEAPELPPAFLPPLPAVEQAVATQAGGGGGGGASEGELTRGGQGEGAYSEEGLDIILQEQLARLRSSWYCE